MEPYVERNFLEFLLPLAGQGPHVCLHLGMQNPGHGAWICRNVVPAVDDAYFGTDDFCGAVSLHKTAVDLLSEFSNARVWPYPAQQFLWDMPPMVAAACGGMEHPVNWGPTNIVNWGPTIIYIDGSRDHAVAKPILEESWNLLRPGGTCIINGYRTGRRRRELYPMVDTFFDESIAADLWEPLCDNRQFGFRKVV